MVKNGRIEDNGGMIKESFCRHGKIEDECPLCNEPEEVRANQLTKQNAALRAEVAELRAKNEEWEQSFELFHKAIIRGDAMFQEKHPEYKKQLRHPSTDKLVCWLLEQLAEMEQRDEVWRGKKEMLENDLGKAWEQLARYREAFLLSRKVVDDCEETLRHVLNYVEGQGLSAEQDVKETIEAIHMIRDGTVRLVEGESK